MEIIKPTEALLPGWKGYDWRLENGNRNNEVSLWRVDDVDEAGYDKAVRNLAKVSPQTIQTIRGIFPKIPQLNIEVAVFPKSQYREKLGLAPSIPDWVRVCVRDNRVCYEQSLASQWEEDLATVPAEQRREIVHEFLHPSIRGLLGAEHKLPLSIEEGIVETVPRLVLGYQQELPESTGYLTGNLEAELVSPQDIDTNGLFHYSQNPLSFNRGYMSAFALVTGLASRLNGNVETGLKALVETIVKFNSRDSFYGQLAKAIDIDEQELLDGKQLQEEGLKLIAKWVRN